MSKLVLGIDIGTSGIKTAIFDDTFTALDNYYEPLSIDKEGPFSTQSVQQSFDRLLHGIRSLDEHLLAQVMAVSFSSAMHSLILLDQHHIPLTENIIWADQRSEEIARKLLKTPTGRSIYSKTGTPIHSMSPLTKIRWFAQEQPEVWSRAKYFCGIKEYIIFLMTGELTIDYSIASATGLFNLMSNKWDSEALIFAQISAKQLPKLVPVTYKTKLKSQLQGQLGLQKNPYVIQGASDGCLANLASEPTDAGDAVLTIGTSAAVRKTISEARISKSGSLFTYYLDQNQYVIGGPSNNGGIVLSWFQQNFCAKTPIEALISDISTSDHFDADLLFFPWLLGERAPFWDNKVLFGFLYHGKEHFSVESKATAVLEAIIFNIKLIIELMHQEEIRIDTLYLTGGFSKSAFIAQLISDTLGLTIIIKNVEDASLRGATIIGFKALGIEMTDAKNTEQEPRKFFPRPDKERLLSKKYNRFKNAYFSGQKPNL